MECKIVLSFVKKILQYIFDLDFFYSLRTRLELGVFAVSLFIR